MYIMPHSVLIIIIYFIYRYMLYQHIKVCYISFYSIFCEFPAQYEHQTWRPQVKTSWLGLRQVAIGGFRSLKAAESSEKPSKK